MHESGSGTFRKCRDVRRRGEVREQQSHHRVQARRRRVPKPSLLAAMPFPKPPANTGTPAQLVLGEVKFTEQCSRCHVFGVSVTPDLRKLSIEVHQVFNDIVLGGAFGLVGMESFSDVLSMSEVDAIHDCLIDQAWQGYNEQEKTNPKQP